MLGRTPRCSSPPSWPSTSSATRAGLSELTIAVIEVVLALALVAFVFAAQGRERRGPCSRSRDLLLINIAFIAVLWNLWFFRFWSVAIVADAAPSSFGKSAMIAAFNAGAGILGFPVGGWLSDAAVRRGIGRRPLVVGFTAVQCALTVVFGLTVARETPRCGCSPRSCSPRARSSTPCSRSRRRCCPRSPTPEHHGAAFGMNNLIGEIGAVLSPAVSGALRDATGGWEAAIFLDAALIGVAVVMFLLVREGGAAGARRRAPARRAGVVAT